MTTMLKLIWRATFGQAYDRLFKRYFQATISRLDAALGGIHTLESDLSGHGIELRHQGAAVRNQSNAIVDYGVELRTHVDGLYKRIDELSTRLVELDEQMRTVLASHWEHEALVRRMIMLEDHLEQAGGSDRQGR